jgi:hypothetical protein
LYLTPVIPEDMKLTIEGAENDLFKYSGSYTNPNDAVGELIGGNKEQNDTMDLLSIERLDGIFDLPKLFTDDSSHSDYLCADHSIAQCGNRPK